MFKRHISKIKPIVLFLFLVNVLFACSHKKTNESDFEKPTILLISFDAFRWDYPEKADTPNLDFLIKTGVRAKSLIPCFPTKTFPNHYSIVTGLYPANHGIIANNMYDPKMDERFSLGNRDAVRDSRWWGGEPIWVTAEKQGLVTAAFFWPGTETKIKNIQPKYWFPYDGSVPNEQRVDQVLKWLDLPEAKRPQFITIYFSHLDDVGHRANPDSKEVSEAIHHVDVLLGRLIDGLKTRNIFNKINLIIVSDHGMAATSRDKIIFLDDYIDISDVDVLEWTPFLALNPKHDSETIYDRLNKAHPHLKIFRKEELPDRFHYKNNRRIPAIIGLADEGWSISTHSYVDERPHYGEGGNHGYDPALKSMGATFIARGPAFKSGLVVEPFLNIHLYELMTAILNLPPAPNDGSLDSVRVMLQDN